MSCCIIVILVDIGYSNITVIVVISLVVVVVANSR